MSFKNVVYRKKNIAEKLKRQKLRISARKATSSTKSKKKKNLWAKFK